jgi:polar amino acid transport system substrate-binding protein
MIEPRKRVLAGFIGLAAAAGLCACSSSSSASSSSASSASPAASSASASASSSGAAVTLPSSFAGKALVVPQQIGVAPYGYVDSSNALVGFDPDMSTQIGVEIGHPVTNVQASFENGLLGLQSGKYLAVPGADVTPIRLKSYDFAVYLRDSYGFQVLASSPDIPNSMDGLCGLSIGAVSASSELPILTAQAAKCKSEGKGTLTVDTFADQPSVDLALQSKRIQAETNTTSVEGYEEKQEPAKLKVTGPHYSYVDEGFAVLKGNGMAQVLVDALNKMIADGSYATILAKYGASSLAVTKATLVTGSS